MKNSKRILLAIVLFSICLFFVQSSTFAQAKKKCLFLSEDADPGHTTDVELIAWLLTLYDVTIEDVDNIKGTSPAVDTTAIKNANYDFIFLSESVGSSDAKNLKGFTVPVFLTELYATKQEFAGWCNTNTANTVFGTVSGAGNNVVTIVDETHPLAAGFKNGAEVIIVSNTDGANSEYLTYSKPMVDFIKIAVLKSDPTQVIVFGIEKGTAIYNNSGVKDGSLTQKARYAGVGIFASANKYITDDAKKLIVAGINWITASSTAVETQKAKRMDGFVLSQNYPNPFNPYTTITFTLPIGSRTTVKVFDMLGNELTTVLDETLPSGTHQVMFDASRMDSGVYFYQVQSGAYSTTKKMVFMK
ncbi:MAG TPA: T9SS type A sorting domain-containing protein [bacterium]